MLETLMRFCRRPLALIFALLFSFPVFAEDLGRLLDKDEDAIHARMALIRNAKKEINISYYIFKNDLSGKVLLSQLVDAAARGVKVNLLVDKRGYDAEDLLPPQLMTYLQEKGVNVKVYDPQGWRRWFGFLYRMHDKMVLVDGEHAIVGGRNLKNSYFTDRQIRNTRFRDMDIYVQGENGVKSAHEYFRGLWNHEFVKVPKPQAPTAAERQAFESQFRHYNGFVKRYVERYRDRVDATMSNLYRLENVDFGHDIPHLKGRVLGSERPILEAIDAAKDRIVMEAAYLVPTPELEAAFQRARARGVQIDIMTNSALTNDVKFGSLAYSLDREKLMAMGIRLWEYIPKPGEKGTLHTKALYVDNKRVYVGTFNSDPRSQYYNLEVGFSVESEDMVRDFQHRMRGHGDKAYLVVPERFRRHPSEVYGVTWNDHWRGGEPGRAPAPDFSKQAGLVDEYERVRAAGEVADQLRPPPHPNGMLREQFDVEARNRTFGVLPSRADCANGFFKLLLKVPLIRNQL